ncbi:ABC transporter permease [Corticibacter populi]|uniref:ABC transporter permease n=1 Tax=Corticibacter populi TaxID=1550736 RepID=A0A3M6R090_9BURK|nr:ABC transporter permease [Corticibacter populi]RMX08676.1 ABC transporter permease [Corticibacter populi]RZS36017.1 NitT/TauT family transport system permease protein/sulfonate transport system permease protein [Corticibacter populi]
MSQQALEREFLARHRSRKQRALQQQIWLGSLGILLFLLAWEVAPRVIPGVNIKMFPPPSHIVGVFAQMTWTTGEIWPHLGASLLRALWGFLLGSIAGILVGVTTGRWLVLRQISDPVLHGLRAIPAIAIVPLAIVWFGLGDISKVMLIAWGTFFPVWINTFIGVRDIPQVYLRSAATLGTRPGAMLLQVALPAALPFIFAGLRQATAVAFVVLVAAELVGAEKGLGYLISFAHLVFRVDIMFVGLIYLGAIGFLVDQLFAWSLHRFFPWYGADAKR